MKNWQKGFTGEKKPKNSKMSKKSTNIGLSSESRLVEPSGNGSQPNRNNPTFPLSQANLALNSQKGNVEMSGNSNQQLSERIKKRQLPIESDDEIEVDYESLEEDFHDEVNVKYKNQNHQKINEKGEIPLTNLQDESDDLSDDSRAFVGSIFGENESSDEVIMEPRKTTIIEKQPLKKAQKVNPKQSEPLKTQKAKRKGFPIQKEKFGKFLAWREERNHALGTIERSKYDFLPQFEASQKGCVRVAMLLSLNLEKLPSISYEDRILAWVDNIVGYLQDGACWENLVSWMRGGYPTEIFGNIQELGTWEVVAGRVFFHDLISL